MEPIAEILTYPEQAIQKYRGRLQVPVGIFAALSAWLHVLISLLILFRARMEILPFAVLFTASGCFILAFLSFKTMALHFLAEMWGGKGQVKSFFTAIGLSAWPLHLALPLTLATRNLAILIPAFLILVFWCNALSFKALQENYKISPRRALAVSMTPSLAVFFLAVMLAATLLAVLT